MKQKLYGRVAILDIGLPGQEGKRFRSFYVDEDSRTITDGLRMTFKIEKTSESNPNKSHIEIYNLAPDSLALLKKPNCRVVLSAGYGLILENENGAIESTAEVIFTGDTSKSATKKSGPDYITTIEAGDGLSAFQNTTINESLREGTTGTTAIQQVISAMGLQPGEIKGADGFSYSGNLVLSGNARDSLDDVTDKGDLEWSIQDEQVQVLPINGFNSLDPIVLTERTGLIGSPNRTGFNNSKNKKDKDSGIEFVSLLQPGLKPGRRVQIKSKFIEGVFVVRKVNINGDTRSGPWFSECEALPV